eukprot:TRINITY_DN7097_c0_g1_i1.p1 TRINITY_DN7097_c0_g1~~TRINITY_DN7097_c0_g1_i1.p1  ORF type:complete len:207 (+),score=39.47 TRINITY_DN7097_c0_g1_i1:55-621(+)
MEDRAEPDVNHLAIVFRWLLPPKSLSILEDRGTVKRCKRIQLGYTILILPTGEQAAVIPAKNTEYQNWQSVMLVSKKWYTAAGKVLNPSARDNEAICWAAAEGKIDVVRALLRDNRVDPTARDYFPLRRAVKCGHVDIVNLLLKDPRIQADERSSSLWELCNPEVPHFQHKKRGREKGDEEEEFSISL